MPNYKQRAMKMKSFVIYMAMSLFAISVYAQKNYSTNVPFSRNQGSAAKNMADVQNSKIILGPRFTIDISKDGKERQFPFVYKFGRNIFISYSEHSDGVVASPVDAMMISHNNGKTWGKKITNKDFYLTSIFEKDNILHGVVYFTYPESSLKEKMVYWTSVDKGNTWERHEGTVNAPEGHQFKTNKGIWGSMLFHRGMMVMKDGSIQGVMYGQLEGDKKYRVVWVKSTDDCKTWNIISTVASGIPDRELKNPQGYCEPNFTRVRNGSVLCVMRMGSYLPLFQSRSYDNGLTWTKPVPLPGLPDSVSESVDPNLLLIKNGVLALSYGRPGGKMAFSTDGCGYKWDVHLNTYEGVTTGYTGIVEVRRNKLLLIADQGANWSKGAYEKAIWGRFIHVDLKPIPTATDTNL